MFCIDYSNKYVLYLGYGPSGPQGWIIFFLREVLFYSMIDYYRYPGPPGPPGQPGFPGMYLVFVSFLSQFYTKIILLSRRSWFERWFW